MQDSRQFVITGVSSGLGLALARALLRDGHRVHGCGRRGDPLAAARAEFGDRYTYRQLDILDAAAVRGWAADIEAGGAVIDFLIHNAAVIHADAPLWEIDATALDAVLDINIKGSFNVLRAFLPAMLKRGRGVLITLSSGAGRSGIPNISGYCASKWAVEGLTKSLAAELPDGMAAIPLSPGIVDTDMLRVNFGERAARYRGPEAWAQSAVPYILGLGAGENGQSLTVPEA
jgi:NAD(P)-dependent dehydrogenase (short-subunit alcohol dehydrogenase family)